MRKETIEVLISIQEKVRAEIQDVEHRLGYLECIDAWIDHIVDCIEEDSLDTDKINIRPCVVSGNYENLIIAVLQEGLKNAKRNNEQS